MLLHGQHSQHPLSPHASAMDGYDQARRALRKRKAETQENERLSKRMSLLNIEQNGTKLYVPVEAPSLHPSQKPPHLADTPDDRRARRRALREAARSQEQAMMDLDDSKHKVYIYNLDDELSSDSEPEDGSGRLLFLPDIERHLRENRIPPRVMQNDDGELAGMQLVLYREPAALSVPQEQDGVRKAVVEARQRLRDRQRLGRGGGEVSMDDGVCEAGALLGEGQEVVDPDAMDMS